MTITNEKLDALEKFASAVTDRAWCLGTFGSVEADVQPEAAQIRTRRQILMAVGIAGERHDVRDARAAHAAAADPETVLELVAEIRRLRAYGDTLMAAASVPLNNGADTSGDSWKWKRPLRTAIEEWNRIALASARKGDQGR